jgi:26S proteasome regulatory subunit N5
VQAGDAVTTAKTAVAILKLCADAGDFATFLSTLLALSKRRGQLKQAIADMVADSIKYLEAIKDKDQRLQLITTLRTVTEGKVRALACERLGGSDSHHILSVQIYVEVERARLTKMLAQIREEEGKVAEASEILQEVAVETYGSMEKREKADFILEQVRLTLAQGDFSRMGILANKITKKVLDEPGMEDLRLRFVSHSF